MWTDATLARADADLVFAEPRPLVADDGDIGDLNDGGEKKISLGPPAGFKCLGRHAVTSPNILVSSSKNSG